MTTENIYHPDPPVEYAVGAVKQDPDSLAVAVRTAHQHDHMAWGVMTTDAGGHHATAAEVEDWTDMAPAEP